MANARPRLRAIDEITLRIATIRARVRQAAFNRGLCRCELCEKSRKESNR